jgi:hypothetical protein
VPGLFTVANASNVKVFYFEAADEPAKANYNQRHYQASWGVWHRFPDNPAVPFQGQFRKEY